MTKSTQRATSYVDYRASKRPKHTGTPVHYSTRIITWEEQLRLPERFHEEEGVWPAVAILDQRGSGDRKEYLLEWEPHPETGEVFEPTWEPRTNVGRALLNSWEQSLLRRGGQRGTSTKSPQRTTVTRPGGSDGSSLSRELKRTGRRRRRVRQDSSSDGQSEKAAANDSRTPTLICSPVSSADESLRPDSPPAEISETQEVSQRRSVSVNIPPVPLDKAEYASLRSSQIHFHQDPTLSISPPFNTGPGTNSQGGDASTQRSDSLDPSQRRKSARVLLTKSSVVDALGPPSPADSSQPATIDVPQSSEKSQNIQRSGPRVASSTPSVQEPSVNTAASSPFIPATFSRSLRRLLNSSKLQHLPSTSQLPDTVELDDSILTPRRDRTSSKQSVTASQPSSLSRSRLSRRERISRLRQISPLRDFQTQVATPQASVSFGGRSGDWQDTKRSFNTLASPQTVPNAGQPTPPTRNQSSPGDAIMASPPTTDLPPLRAQTPTSAAESPEDSLRERVRRARASQRSGERSSPAINTQSTDTPNTSSMVFGPELLGHRSDLEPKYSSSTTDLSVVNLGSHTTLGDRKEVTLAPSVMITQPSAYEAPLGGSALPIQQSIEEEPPSSAEEQTSLDSKASSSQQSLEHERIVPQVDGLVLPTHPILGPAEYAVALAAEGKIQSTYMDTIKAKRKAILKFLQRRDSVGSANGSISRTIERNEMIELIQRLHDTVTHLDLGLPGFTTQYSVRSDQHGAYANYAGSKFAFLGHLVDVLQRVDCSVAIVAQPGPVIDLLEDYLTMKHINVKRHDRPSLTPSQTPARPSSEFRVELLSSTPNSFIELSQPPILMIAFDASFDAQDPQIRQLRERYAGDRPDQLLPVIHLLVTNSSEHVDRCLPKSMPSPLRLKLLVRATYQARTNLGGVPTYVPDPSDEPEGRPMDLSDLQRAVRKSPDRKMSRIASIIVRAALSQDFAANWTLGAMPELQLEELDDLPPTTSGSASVAITPKNDSARSRTPISRADTPSGRKRLLDIDGGLGLSKRQRMTSLHDVAFIDDSAKEQTTQVEQLLQAINALQAEVSAEKEARQQAEHARDVAQNQLAEWKTSLATLQRRYEKRMMKCHELENTNKELVNAMENGRGRQERMVEENRTLKQQVVQLQADLTAARDELKASGGDIATVETAREEARTLAAKNTSLEKSLENTRRDFEFTRSQYQEASNKAAEYAVQVQELEAKVEELKAQAGDERRRLKELNYHDSVQRHLAKLSELELEKKSRETLLRKMDEEIRTLKRNRGIQTRGGSVQPPGSPGPGPRSRQASPAPGLLTPQGQQGHAVHGANRGSLLRHEG